MSEEEKIVKRSTAQITLSPPDGEETPRDVNINGAKNKATQNASKSAKLGSTCTNRVANQSQGKQHETYLCKTLGFCSSCEPNLDDDEDETNGLIECERCQKWICRMCADISPEELTVIVGKERFHWFCDDCDLLAMPSFENSKKIDGKKVNINPGEMQCLVLSRVTKIMDKIEAKNDLHQQKTERITISYAKERKQTDHKVSSQVSSINKKKLPRPM